MYLWPKYNYIDELQRAGNAVFELKVSANLSTDSFMELYREYVKKEGEPDVIISCLDDDFVDDELGIFIQSLSSPSVLICFDNLSIPHAHKKSAKYYDLVWLTSSETELYFKKWGASTIFLPYAANPNVYIPYKGEERNNISFIGSLYGGRISKINYLANNGLPIKIYGRLGVEKNPAKTAAQNPLSAIQMGAQLMRYPIGRRALYSALLKSIKINKFPEISENVSFGAMPSFEEISRIYSCSSLSLGISELWNTHLLKNPVHKIHLRAFEIPMSGGIQITTGTSEMECYFENHKEVIYYYTNEEAIDLAKFYLDEKRSSERSRIRLAARNRSVAQHTWLNRFNKIFEKLGI